MRLRPLMAAAALAALAAPGGERVLYAGDDIDGGSLGLRGSTVSWVAGGALHSATLR